MNKKAKKALLIFGALVGILFLAFVIFRQSILHAVISKAANKFRTDYELTLTIGQARFVGLTTVAVSDLRLYKQGTDTLLSVDTLSAHPSFWRLFTGHLLINHLYCANSSLKLVSLKGMHNFPTRQKTGVKKTDQQSNRRDIAHMLNQLVSKAFDFAPQQAELHDLSFTLINDSVNRTVFLKNAISTKDNIAAEFTEEKGIHPWKVEGKFSQSKKSVDLTIIPGSGGQTVPIVNELIGLKVGFSRVRLALTEWNYSSGLLQAGGLLEADSFRVFHKRISDDQVVLPPARFEFRLTANDNSIRCDSTSTLTLGKITARPFFELDKSSGRKVTLILNTAKTQGTDFFRSLPAGMFDEVRSVEADGSLAFRIDLSVNLDKPDSVRFDASMNKEKFRIRRAGDLFKMQNEFVQPVYEYGQYIRSFAVGPSNPDFTPYDQISSDLRNAILTSEDGSFFYHNGFNEEAFRKSITANLKAGRFVRGGSTISMQLVKNVFLTRKKTIARKAEEALIVWLIESNRIYSKERMLEVYMNIIELGPNIYGVGEASRFYFNKRPAEINLQEGIFLASLLPHPKWFKYSFDTEGKLKPYFADYYRVVGNFLLRKELITPEQHQALQPVIELRGPAKEMVIPSDTILTDSLLAE